MPHTGSFDALRRLLLHIARVVDMCVRFMACHGDPSLLQVPSGGMV